MKILIGGAGGLGCELIKYFKLANHTITAVDYDSVELSNLNRSFYYLKNHISKKKAAILSSQLQTFDTKIQDFDLNNYDVIVLALDNLEARMDVNLLFKDCNTKYLIDVGVNKYNCHIKVVSKQSSCLYCIKSAYEIETDCLGLVDQKYPAVAYFNSIVAGLVSEVVEDLKSFDYVFFSLEDKSIKKMRIVRSPDCLVCSGELY